MNIYVYIRLSVCFPFSFSLPFPGCSNENRVLKDKQGNFASPGGINGYPNNTNACWFIRLSISASVEITFHDFDLELSKTCAPYDSVKVRENCNGTWTANLGGKKGYCGNLTKFNVTSHCGRVLVQFHSDESETGRGFNATYKAIYDKSKCILDQSKHLMNTFTSTST